MKEVAFLERQRRMNVTLQTHEDEELENKMTRYLSKDKFVKVKETFA